MPDLIERLTHAASEAIANERPSLEHRPETIRSVTVELILGRSGGLSDAVVFVERRTKAHQLATLDHASVRSA